MSFIAFRNTKFVTPGWLGHCQLRIQDGAFGANAPPPPLRNCIQDRDTLIEQ